MNLLQANTMISEEKDDVINEISFKTNNRMTKLKETRRYAQLVF